MSQQQTVEEYLAGLPDDVKEIDLSHKKLTILPDLSRFHSLQLLHCHNNSLSTLPYNLPQSLQYLYCDYNSLSHLPDNLPQSLQILHCWNNSLLSLPDNLPQSLQILHCWNNSLSVLPDNLPQSLQILSCYNNSLSSLPDNLPQSLQYLYCWNNPQLNIMYPQCDFDGCFVTPEKYEYIYKVNIQNKVISRMTLLNANGALLEHSARIIGKPSSMILDKVKCQA